MSGNVRSIFIKDGHVVVLVDDGRVLECDEFPELVDFLIEIGAITTADGACAIIRKDGGNGYAITRGFAA